jgi:DNA helicase-2/ATP-dependent DNA helicase PcrA
MTDEAVESLLNSNEPLAVVEAPAGCGKTFQGARYAQRALTTIGSGRLLILTHTHAACSVFADRTRGAGPRVEIRTIDALINQIATAYHKVLDLPPDPSVFAWQHGGKGFEIMAGRVAALLNSKPMIADALARRYPIVICDEHQDSSGDQHSIVMSLHGGGARLRIFGDPWQRLFGGRSDKANAADRARWEALKKQGRFAELRNPHRWALTAPQLGAWILKARDDLRNGRPIDLTSLRPAGLTVIYADNISPAPRAIQIAKEERKRIDSLVDAAGQIMILGGTNSTVDALNAFWSRRIPIWEGHTREHLADLVDCLTVHTGNPEAVAEAFLKFITGVATGFTPSSHGNRLLEEVRGKCKRPAKGKPACIQELARFILQEPNYLGVGKALARLSEMVEARINGFDGISFDYRREFTDAIKLAQFATAQEGYSEISRRRSYARPMPPKRVISTIHKAKGLECENAIVMACDKTHFSSTDYARCKLYVALSRAQQSLTLVVSRSHPTPLFRVGK